MNRLYLVTYFIRIGDQKLCGDVLVLCKIILLRVRKKRDLKNPACQI